MALFMQIITAKFDLKQTRPSSPGAIVIIWAGDIRSIASGVGQV